MVNNLNKHLKKKYPSYLTLSNFKSDGLSIREINVVDVIERPR